VKASDLYNKRPKLNRNSIPFT